MPDKEYTIFLDNKKIGFTKLEKADAPMSVVFGQIHFINFQSGYELFIDYCTKNNIEVDIDAELKSISTRNIPELKVMDTKGDEIKGIGISISGMDMDKYEIEIIGIPYPFYEQAFPHHVKSYNDMFK